MKRYLTALACARRPYFLRAGRPAVFACILPILAACTPQQQNDTAGRGLVLYATPAPSGIK